MTTTTTTASGPPRVSALDRRTAMRLAATEYDRVLELLRSLSPTDWTRPTACAGWDVRALATHMLGMVEMCAAPLEIVRQMGRAQRAGGVFIDALTALQVEDRRELTGADIVQRWTVAAPRAARLRRRMPRLVRHLAMPAMPIGARADSPIERWRWGYLNDVINTRDPWLHRTDIAAAVSRPLHLTEDHDGVLVDDVVREWAARHGEPYRLRLTGPAGGTWSSGSGVGRTSSWTPCSFAGFCPVAAAPSA